MQQFTRIERQWLLSTFKTCCFVSGYMVFILGLTVTFLWNPIDVFGKTDSTDPPCIDIAAKPIHMNSRSKAPVTISGTISPNNDSKTPMLFQTQYHSKGWWGDVLAYGIEATDLSLEQDEPLWKAGQLLNRRPWRFEADNGRQIITYNGFRGIPFREHSDLDPQQQLLLSQKQLDFIRGDRSNEKLKGGPFRNRESVLGDIVSSSAVYHDNYLYVGANDGMLHVFDAAGGEEIYAYIPNLIFNKLARLTDRTYVHQFYIDQSPVIKDIDDKTILVGGLGAGGTGYYCLNVSEAGACTEVNAVHWVLWEFPDRMTSPTDIKNIGYSFSKPVIVKSTAGWIVLFGNGYNSQNGDAVLFALNTDGRKITHIATDTGPCNGLSTPLPVDVNNDYLVDYVYAGDLKGNLWKFDLTSDDPAAWQVAYYGECRPQPLFQARNKRGRIQPITSAPDVMYHCNGFGYMVVIGTGKYIGDSDYDNKEQQSVYGLWDFGDDDDDNEYLGVFNRRAEQTLSNQPESVSLVRQFLDYSGCSGYKTEVRHFSQRKTDYSTIADVDDPSPYHTQDEDQQPNPKRHAGWYFDLPLNKERVIDDVIIRDGKAMVTSIVPGCKNSVKGGDSYIMVFRACSGGGVSNSQFDLNRDGIIDNKDVNAELRQVPSGIKIQGILSLPEILGNGTLDTFFLSASTGEIVTFKQKAEKVGVLYWRTVAK